MYLLYSVNVYIFNVVIEIKFYSSISKSAVYQYHCCADKVLQGLLHDVFDGD